MVNDKAKMIDNIVIWLESKIREKNERLVKQRRFSDQEPFDRESKIISLSFLSAEEIEEIHKKIFN